MGKGPRSPQKIRSFFTNAVAPVGRPVMMDATGGIGLLHLSPVRQERAEPYAGRSRLTDSPARTLPAVYGGENP